LKKEGKMEKFIVRLHRETKSKNEHLISATVDQFSGGICVGSGFTPQAAFEDMFSKLVQTFKERGINPNEREFSVIVIGLKGVIGDMHDKDGLSEDCFKGRLIRELKVVFN
jgi:hypothetical protein